LQTLHKYAYPAFGDFDIFMTVNKYIADDPKPICEPYKPKSNSNKLFCETIEDGTIITILLFIRTINPWRRPRMKEKMKEK